MKRKISPVPAVAGCLVIQLCVGILYLWSVFKDSVGKSFDWPAGSVRMVASYMLLSFVAGNFIGGILNDRKGPKFTAAAGVIMFAFGVGATGLLTKSSIGLMYITYCLIGGLGSGFAYGACISCVQKWLPHRRGLASGLAVCAFGLSTVIFSPVSKLLMDVFTDKATGLVSFRPVFFILAGVFLAFGLAACTLVRLPSADYLKDLPLTAGKSAGSGRSYTLAQAVKTVPFWCIFLYIFFINGTWNLTVPLIYDLGHKHRGLSDAAALFALSFTGIANAAGRLSMAALSDKIGRVAANLILSGLTLAGAALMTFISGYPYIIVVAVIAFAYGGPAAINPAISTDFFGPKYSGTNYGVIMLALGLSSVFFNWISTLALGGNVASTFIMAGGTAAVSVVFMLVIGVYLKRLGKN